MKTHILILAAGKGTRIKSDKPKVLHEAAFHPLLYYVLKAAKSLDGTCYTVVGHGADEVKEAFLGQCEFVLQREQRGTGHAVREVLPALGTGDGTVLVLCGDTPLLRGETLASFLEYHQAAKHHCTVMTTHIIDPQGYGRILRDQQDRLFGIVEERDATPEEKKIHEINSGVYCFDKAFLEDAVAALKNDNDQGEFYLTDAIAYGREHGCTLGAWRLDDADEIMGVNDRLQLAAAGAALHRRKNEALMRDGVTMLAPSSTYIDPEAEIGFDTVIEANTVIRGRCHIGENSHIGPNAELNNTSFGKGVRFWHSIAVDCRGGDMLNIGPFAYLRPGCVLADKVKIGDFVEVKNSQVGEGSKIPHLAYVGDSDVGSKSNLGCGMITCNYDGTRKYRTIIGDNVFIGSNATLVAPLTIESKGYVAAGSTITEDVPSGSLGVGRGRQRNIEKWVDKFYE